MTLHDGAGGRAGTDASQALAPATSTGATRRRAGVRLRHAELASGYVAVYVVGPKEGWPVRIGITASPREIVKLAQQWFWGEVWLHALAWTPGRPAAARLKAHLETALGDGGRRIRGSWFDMMPDEAESALLFAADEARVPVFDEDERQRRLARAIESAVARIR